LPYISSQLISIEEVVFNGTDRTSSFVFRTVILTIPAVKCLLAGIDKRYRANIERYGYQDKTVFGTIISEALLQAF
jgi:hypothetical protein